MPSSIGPSREAIQDNTQNVNTMDAAATETTPLLAPEIAITRDQNGKAIPENVLEAEDERMPYTQILLLCYASLAEPVAYFSIFPFINAMIAETGSIPEASVGFYSGMIESLFSLVQMVLMIFYGRMSDRLGRKPILVFSLAGVSIATALFGMSRTLWQMIMFRCLAGVFAGSVVTVRTMLSENSGKKTQGRAFAWYMFTRNMGIFLGPLVGGGLANPADQFPGTFGDVRFFKDYPYALATFVAGTICMTGTLSSLLFLKEVNSGHQHCFAICANKQRRHSSAKSKTRTHLQNHHYQPSKSSALPAYQWSVFFLHRLFSNITNQLLPGPVHLRSHNGPRLSFHSNLSSLLLHLHPSRRPFLLPSPNLPILSPRRNFSGSLDASSIPLPPTPPWHRSSSPYMRHGLANIPGPLPDPKRAPTSGLANRFLDPGADRNCRWQWCVDGFRVCAAGAQ